MKYDRRFCHFESFFTLLKNEMHVETLSFYTCVPKIMIIWSGRYLERIASGIKVGPKNVKRPNRDMQKKIIKSENN